MELKSRTGGERKDCKGERARLFLLAVEGPVGKEKKKKGQRRLVEELKKVFVEQKTLRSWQANPILDALDRGFCSGHEKSQHVAKRSGLRGTLLRCLYPVEFLLHPDVAG